MISQPIEQDKLTSQIVSQQEPIGALAIEDQKVPVLLKKWSSTKGKPSATRNNIATALLARDWKGFDNYGSNGVVEKG